MEIFQQEQAAYEVEKSFDKEPVSEFISQQDLLSERDLNILLSSGSPKKILIVEDDLSQINMLEELILEINPETEIDWELDANIAITRINCENHSRDRRGYDLVISDIALGEKSSGIDLFHYCLETQPKLKIILISAHPKEKLKRNHFRRSGPVEYLQKPLDFGVFFAKLAPFLLSG